MPIYNDNSLAIGRTPLVRLNRICPGGATVFAKVEGRNPGYSVKCRVGASLVWEAERSGRLKPGMGLLEASSGNTGIGLAMAAASRGYRLLLVMQEGLSEERLKVLTMLGAEIKLTDPALGMQGAIDEAERLERESEGQYYYTRQFENPANPLIHEQTTGPEIWADLDGQVDALVASAGTGGTLTGLGKFFKKVQGRPVWMTAVEPKALPAISYAMAGGVDLLPPAGHLIQGIGPGFIPKNLDLNLLDQVIGVSDRDAVVMARRLAREEGILAGISSGAAVVAAAQLAQVERFKGKNIVVILPDSGDRYVSTVLYSDLFEDKKAVQRP